MDLAAALADFHRATRIPVRVCAGSAIERAFSAMPFEPDLALGLIPGALASEAASGFSLTDEQLFCGYVKIEATGAILLAGPISAFRHTRAAAARICRRNGLSSARADSMFEYIRRLPLLTLEQSLHCLSLLDCLANGKAGREPARMAAMPALARRGPPAGFAPLRTSFLEHRSPRVEEALLSFVEHGMPDAVEAALDSIEMQPIGVPEITEDAVRSHKDIAMFALGIVSRTALRGGLDYDACNELCGYFLSEFERHGEYREITNGIKRMMLAFADRVRLAKGIPGGSPTVAKIRRIIFSRVHEKISPSIIVRLGFSSQNYMATVFKKTVGTTPENFRNASAHYPHYAGERGERYETH
jgi:AraC-like DNA-binding protein